MVDIIWFLYKECKTNMYDSVIQKFNMEVNLQTHFKTIMAL